MRQRAANYSSDLSVWLCHVISCPARKQSCPGQDPCEAAVPSDESHNSRHQMVSQFNRERGERKKERKKKHIHAYRDWCVFIKIFAVLHRLLLILHHYESKFKSMIHSVLPYQPALLVSGLLLWRCVLLRWRSSIVTVCVFTALTCSQSSDGGWWCLGSRGHSMKKKKKR